LVLFNLSNIWINLRVGFVHVLSSSIRSLVDYSWCIDLLLRNIDLLGSLDFLNITWVTIIIAIISLRGDVFSEAKEVILSQSVFSWSLDYLSSLRDIRLLSLLEREYSLRTLNWSLNYLSSILSLLVRNSTLRTFNWSLDYLSSLLWNISLLSLLVRELSLRQDLRLNLALVLYLRHLRFVIIPIGINSLLDQIILSRLTILIDKSFNIPSQLLVFAIDSHGLDKLLFFGMIKVSIRLINLGQSRICIQRQHSLSQSKVIITFEISNWLFSFSFDFWINLWTHSSLELIENVTLKRLSNIWVLVSESIHKIILVSFDSLSNHQRRDVSMNTSIIMDVFQSSFSLT
jgi:hypothetical protein